MRTYVIEPQLVFADYLEGVLAAAGFTVVATRDQIDGKDIAALAPAAVFVDLDFFDRGGPNALCKIRQAMPLGALIAYSTSEDPTYAASCYISGADAVISKQAGEEGVLSSLREAALPAGSRN
jgi:DNA-binding NarL/FixJ family response regulator